MLLSLLELTGLGSIIRLLLVLALGALVLMTGVCVLFLLLIGSRSRGLTLDRLWTVVSGGSLLRSPRPKQLRNRCAALNSVGCLGMLWRLMMWTYLCLLSACTTSVVIAMLWTRLTLLWATGRWQVTNVSALSSVCEHPARCLAYSCVMHGRMLVVIRKCRLSVILMSLTLCAVDLVCSLLMVWLTVLVLIRLVLVKSVSSRGSGSGRAVVSRVVLTTCWTRTGLTLDPCVTGG